MKKCSTSLAIKENANQNNIEIPFQFCSNSYHQEHKQQQMLVRMWGKGTLIHYW
jgi:hypothetical protein